MSFQSIRMFKSPRYMANKVLSLSLHIVAYVYRFTGWSSYVVTTKLGDCTQISR